MSDYKLTRSQRFALASEANCEIRTVEKYLKGTKMRPSTVTRLQKAAAALGIVLPLQNGEPATAIHDLADVLLEGLRKGLAT